MYSETDLESAVTAGVLSPDAAAAFRLHVAASRAAPIVDEESFRLITGFNDIFVAIASVLLLVAVGWIGGNIAPALGCAGVAVTAWGLAEYFTRERRMALPSILLLLAFVGGVFGACATGTIPENADLSTDAFAAVLMAGSAAIAAGAAWLHWQRFHVPITVAAGAGALVALAISLLIAAVPEVESWLRWLMLAAGIGIFAFAMHWDMSDRERRTRRSDVAFWLHLLAAPLIVHPIFSLLGLLEGTASIGNAVIVIALYVALGLVALAIDRRALLVSALAYVLFALSTLFREFGAVSLNVALTALVIGSALLLLSAFWTMLRAALIGAIGGDWAERLPPARTLDHKVHA